jgi:dihydroorotate dehydrogenase electron transfer subunit
MRQFESQILGNRRIGDGFYEMSLSWDDRAGAPMPGQFMTLRVTRDTVPLLRRPFAFAGFDGRARAVSVIYQKRGRGTEILAARRPGDAIDVVGPLGNTFPIDDTPQKAIAVAGGVGLGPILFLVSTLRARGVETEFVFGCRGESLIPDCDAFRESAARVCTENGGAGFHGNVVQYMNANTGLDDRTAVYACGPAPMLESVCDLARSLGAQAWVSLEAVMACGIGACVGCAVPAKTGYPRVCREGPVFNGKDILWEQM